MANTREREKKFKCKHINESERQTPNNHTVNDKHKRKERREKKYEDRITKSL
jgi:hypothetical protein